MRLILVRHPQPMVAPGICYGSTDLAVAPDELARTLSALAPTLPRGLAIYSSPPQRCAGLAARLAPLLQSPEPIVDARIAEMDFGAWEMLPWDDIPRAGIDAWAADMVNYRPGGGESVLAMALRIATFHADLQRQHGGTDDTSTNADADADENASAIIICHAGAMRLLSACHAGLAPAEMALQAAQTPHKIAYGATLVLQHQSPKA